MLEPSIDALQEKIDSKYVLVSLAATRARELLETKNVLVEDSKSRKYVGMALEEVKAGKLFVDESK